MARYRALPSHIAKASGTAIRTNKHCGGFRQTRAEGVLKLLFSKDRGLLKKVSLPSRRPSVRPSACSLPWRPPQFPSPQHVQVQMIDALAGVLSGVSDDSIARRIESLFGSHVGCKGQERPEQLLSFAVPDIPHSGNVSCGNNQHVHRRLGIDVVEGKRLGRSLHDFRRDLSCHDPAKEAFSHGALAAAPER